MAKASDAAFVGGVLGALLLPGTVRAEGGVSSQPSSARPAATELATGACRLGRWAAAVDLLRIVPAEARSADGWLCLARAQVGLGKWVESLDSYDELAERSAADPHARNARRVGALERQALEARLAWLQVVPSDPLTSDTRLTLDGEPIARGRIGVEFPVQPGARTIGVEGHGVTRDLANLTLREGEHRRLTLALPLESRIGRERTALLAAPTDASTPAQHADYARWSRGALYGGALGAGVGLTLLGTSGKAGSDASSFQVVGLSSLVLGGLSFMSAAVLRFIDDSESANGADRAPSKPRLEPWVTAHRAGIAGSF